MRRCCLGEDLGRSVPDDRNSKYKGPQEGSDLVCLRYIKEARVVGAE